MLCEIFKRAACIQKPLNAAAECMLDCLRIKHLATQFPPLHGLFSSASVLNKFLLLLFVCIPCAKLFKSIARKSFKAVNVQNGNRRCCTARNFKPLAKPGRNPAKCKRLKASASAANLFGIGRSAQAPGRSTGALGKIKKRAIAFFCLLLLVLSSKAAVWLQAVCAPLHFRVLHAWAMPKKFLFCCEAAGHPS